MRTDFALDAYTQIIFERYNACLPTVVTTNYTAEGLAGQIGEPVVSRLREMCAWVEVAGTDRRATFQQ